MKLRCERVPRKTPQFEDYWDVPLTDDEKIIGMFFDPNQPSNYNLVIVSTKLSQPINSKEQRMEK